MILKLEKKKYSLDIDIFNISNKKSSITNYQHVSSVQYYFIELELLLNCLRNKLPDEIIEKIHYFTPKKENLISTGNYGYYFY